MNAPIIIKPPQRSITSNSKESLPAKQILTIDDAIAHYSKLLELAPQLLDILAFQRYEVDNLQKMTAQQKLDLLAHLIAVKTIAELNERFNKYPPINKAQKKLALKLGFNPDWLTILKNKLEGVEITTMKDVTKNILELTENQINGKVEGSVSNALRYLGYRKGKRTIDGKKVSVWIKPTEEISTVIEETLTENQNE
ncbi:hypothetical protein ACN4EE_07240 [Geminocystis sp. CENA526]